VNTTGAVLLLGGVFLAYEAVRFMAVKEMTFSLASLDAGQNGLTTDLSIGVQVDNPSNFTNTIDSLIGDVYNNDRYIGHAAVIGPIPLPAKSSTKVPVSLQVSDLALVASILALFANKPSNQVITFKGNLLADGIPLTIPLNISYQIV
jgi:LEA14-like dessication related protein